MSVRIVKMLMIIVVISLTVGCGGSDSGGGLIGIPPTLSILAPTLGTVLKGGGTVDIIWSASDDQAIPAGSISLQYSQGGGYTVIVSGLDDTGLYTWTVPAIDSATVTVMVTVTDSSGNTVSDISSTFTVDSTLPVITADEPSAPVGPIAEGGTTPIEFSVTDSNLSSNYVTLEYNDGGGGGWVEIISALDNSDSPYDWYVPAGLSAGQVRVTGTDAAGNVDRAVAVGTVDSAADTTDPTVLNIYYGIDGSTADLAALDGQNIGRGEYFTIVFSETMDTALAETGTTLTPAPAGLEYYWLTTTATNDMLVVVPTVLLDDDTAYTLSVGGGAQDLAGRGLNVTAAASADFNTNAVDTTPPTLTSAVTNTGSILVDGAGGAMLSVTGGTGGGVRSFTFQFNENISITGTSFVIDSGMTEIASSNNAGCNLIPSGSQLVVELNIDEDLFYGEAVDDALPLGRGYSVSLGGITDLAGNLLETEEFAVVVVGAGIGTAAPYCISTLPADGETNVTVDTIIRLMFSEVLDFATVTTTNITVTGATSGPLVIQDLVADMGAMVSLRVQGGLPVDEDITVAVTTGLTDADGVASAGESFTFHTSSIDDTVPGQIFYSTLSGADTSISVTPSILVNLNEAVDPDSIDRTKVAVRDKLTGVRINAFDVEPLENDIENNHIALSHNGLGSELANDRTYVVEIFDVADIVGNLSDVSIEFTTHAAAGYARPAMLSADVGVQVFPPFIFGLPGTDMQQMFMVSILTADADDDIDTVTITDGTSIWDLGEGPSDDWGMTRIDASVATGVGEFLVTITDMEGLASSYKLTYFIPTEYPQQVSPQDGAAFTTAESVVLNWTVPEYNNSVTMIGLSQDPGGIFGSSLPSLFLDGKTTTLTIPDDYGLYPSWYFWSLIHTVFGYDVSSMVISYDQGTKDLFIYEEPTLPTISGNITQLSGLTSGPIVVILDDGSGGMPHAVTMVDVPGAYSVPNVDLPTGTYYMHAYRDADHNMEENDGEAVTIIPLNINWTNGVSQTNINMTLEGLVLNSIAGTISHAAIDGGTEEGNLVIMALNTGAGPDYMEIMSEPGAYIIADMEDGSYSVTAFRDTNGNFSPDAGEGLGFYGSITPTAIPLAGGPTRPIYHLT